VPVVVLLVRESVVGENAPPPLLSLGVTTTVPEIVPSAPTVKLVEAILTVPELGPERVRAVAPPEVTLALQLAVDPPFDPVQDQTKGPAPVTLDAVPLVQRLVVGALEKLCP
jgi:hypothetical protein